MISYSTYKFCITAWITIPLMFYAFFYLAFCSFGLPLLAALLIGILCTLLCLSPAVAHVGPYIVGIAMVVDLALTNDFGSALFFILCLAIILHVARTITVFRFAKNNPETSLSYDVAYRTGDDVAVESPRHKQSGGRKWLLFVMGALLLISVSGNVFQLFHGLSVESGLSDELADLKNTHRQTCSDYYAVKNEYDEIRSDYLFWVKHGAIVSENASYYHIFPDCAQFSSGCFWIYNVEAAEDLGYSACRFCNARRTDLLN